MAGQHSWAAIGQRPSVGGAAPGSAPERLNSSHSEAAAWRRRTRTEQEKEGSARKKATRGSGVTVGRLETRGRAMAPKRSTRAAAGMDKELPPRTSRPPRNKATAEGEARRKTPNKAPTRKAAPKHAGKQGEGALEGISQNLARLVDRMGKLESRVYQRSERTSASPQRDAPRGRRRTRDNDVSRSPSISPASSGDDSTAATERTKWSGGGARKKSRRSSRRCCQTATDSDSAETQYIPGVHNEVADALSRFQDDRFRSLAPEADLQPTIFPQELWTLGEEKPGQN
nr:PREDICTED: uncharacterized protein LOC103278285 [Anolis carolinensis]|eukprot:XP_016847764.1 PREDICTED: uncharacterized protein LOC103278285 [Anolis carolinensis]